MNLTKVSIIYLYLMKLNLKLYTEISKIAFAAVGEKYEIIVNDDNSTDNFPLVDEPNFIIQNFQISFKMKGQ